MGAFFRVITGAAVWFLLVTICVGLILSICFSFHIVTSGQADSVIGTAIIVGTIYGGWRGFHTTF